MCGILIPASDGATRLPACYGRLSPQQSHRAWCHPGAFPAGIERPAKICTPGAEVTTSGAPRCSTSSTVNFPLLPGQNLSSRYKPSGQRHEPAPDLPVGIVQFNIKLVSLKAPLSVRVMLIRRSLILPVISLRRASACNPASAYCLHQMSAHQHYPAPVIPVNLVAILPALP